MFFYGVGACLGSFKPFAKIARLTVATIFLVGILVDVGLAMYTAFAVETFYIHSGITTVFLIILGSGMMFGYTSKFARFVLPFSLDR